MSFVFLFFLLCHHLAELKAEFFPFCWLSSDREVKKKSRKIEPLSALAVSGSLDKKFFSEME
ncbi:hypothetical protein JTF06_04400 [Desemzia sp. RIT804]|uniref:hypothetical protein n=1 Tax=Desemzia sp. RIT 804 TaxID=2810209 RepID=UPI001951FFE0|nr:hypothetical protein [Desemzia sp. RIT 804]MBM6613964.1 hypothetical protein [Desemzia sp. RIT 804]MBM6614047.1 hypothetical protein [Desemzia sp. RIT 804]MBM6614130.1 hypothetical protein [Desemzia sp. RIT 804]